MSSLQEPQYTNHLINKFPNETLKFIFSFLSTHDLVHSVQFVCWRWREVANHLYIRQLTTLSLTVSDYRARHWNDMFHAWWLTQQRWDDGTFEENAVFVGGKVVFDQAVCEQLVAKFPSISKLNLYGVNIREDELAWLLSHYPNLTQLIWVWPDEGRYGYKTGPPTNGATFMAALNTLTHLTTLILPSLPWAILSGFANLRDTFGRLETMWIPFNTNISFETFQIILQSITPRLRNVSLKVMSNFLVFDEQTRLYDTRFSGIYEGAIGAFGQIDRFYFRVETRAQWQQHNTIRQIQATANLHRNVDVNTYFFLGVLEDIDYALRQKLLSLRIVVQPYDLWFQYTSMESDYDEEGDQTLQPIYASEEQYWDAHKYELGYNFFSNLRISNYRRLLLKMPRLHTLYLCNVNLCRWEHFSYLRFAFPGLVTLYLENVELSLLPTVGREQEPISVRLYETLRQFGSLKRVYRNASLAIDLERARTDETHKREGIRLLMKKMFHKIKYTAPKELL